MPQFIERVSPPLSAGWISRRNLMTGHTSGVFRFGGPAIEWELGGDTVTVTHRQPTSRRRTRYAIRLTFTEMSSGGERWWWLCPECGQRVDDLYLPPGRDKLGCRICCGLRYRSQYRPKRSRCKQPKPLVIRGSRWWTPATGWVKRSW